MPALDRRRKIGSIRRLRPYHQTNLLDFSSNDYLGLAQSRRQQIKVKKALDQLAIDGARDKGLSLLGSTGSRLLTGDSTYAQALESKLARWHKRPAALLCNSGYDANLSVLSCLTLHTNVLMDELAHNSMQMGIRLSKGCTVKSFRHNDVQDLEHNLQKFRSSRESPERPIIVVVESVYSMDGDVAPLKEILAVSLAYNACVIVDEAHGLGVFGETGMGVLEQCRLENHPALLCSVHTFGKAAGCHGAVVCGSIAVKEYLLNYGRPIIYSTSQPIHSLVTTMCSYESMVSNWGQRLREDVSRCIKMFRDGMAKIMARTRGTISLVDSFTPIQAMLIPGNSVCILFCEKLWDNSNQTIRLYPIRSPTVPKGQERVRIIVHSHNTDKELRVLLDCIETTLGQLGLIDSTNSGHVRSKL